MRDTITCFKDGRVVGDDWRWLATQNCVDLRPVQKAHAA